MAKLRLHKETLRALTSDDLRGVHGGTVVSDPCRSGAACEKTSGTPTMLGCATEVGCPPEIGVAPPPPPPLTGPSACVCP